MSQLRIVTVIGTDFDDTDRMCVTGCLVFT